MSVWTVHAVLVGCWLNQPKQVDQHTGKVIRRYEHDGPRATIQVDAKSLGNVPKGRG
jgi:hypothetical protein